MRARPAQYDTNTLLYVHAACVPYNIGNISLALANIFHPTRGRNFLRRANNIWQAEKIPIFNLGGALSNPTAIIAPPHGPRRTERRIPIVFQRRTKSNSLTNYTRLFNPDADADVPPPQFSSTIGSVTYVQTGLFPPFSEMAFEPKGHLCACDGINSDAAGRGEVATVTGRGCNHDEVPRTSSFRAACLPALGIFFLLLRPGEGLRSPGGGGGGEVRGGGAVQEGHVQEIHGYVRILKKNCCRRFLILAAI